MLVTLCVRVWTGCLAESAEGTLSLVMRSLLTDVCSHSPPLASPHLVAQLVKNPPATMLETWVRSLGGDDPREKGMATHSSILAWRIPLLLCPWGHRESDTTEGLTHLVVFRITAIAVGPPYYNPRELQRKHQASGSLFAGTWDRGILKIVGRPRQFVGGMWRMLPSAMW